MRGGGFSGGTSTGGDTITQLDVDAANQTYRSVLTDFIPPGTYGPIIWSAGTNIARGKSFVSVKYTGPQRHPAQAIRHNMDLEEFLLDQGQKFSLYFTMEENWRGPNGSNLATLNIRIPQELKSGDDLVAYLRAQRQDAEILSDPNNSKIIHVVEKSLLADKDYVMSKQTTVQFKETPAELLTKFFKESAGQFWGPPDFVSGAVGKDTTTKITVDARDRPYRDLLSDFLPLEHYNHVIWVAELHSTRDNKSAVEVLYRGPIVSPLPPFSKTTTNDPTYPHIAFIAMAPAAPLGQDPIADSPDYLHLTLKPDHHEWFATTPLVAALSDGCQVLLPRTAKPPSTLKHPRRRLQSIARA